MQELILVISRCISKSKNIKGEKIFYRFHFKGYYSGQKIKVIHVFAEADLLSKGEDYLLWVKQKKLFLEILEVDLIKYKKIN